MKSPQPMPHFCMFKNPVFTRAVHTQPLLQQRASGQSPTGLPMASQSGKGFKSLQDPGTRLWSLRMCSLWNISPDMPSPRIWFISLPRTGRRIISTANPGWWTVLEALFTLNSAQPEVPKRSHSRALLVESDANDFASYLSKLIGRPRH